MFILVKYINKYFKRCDYLLSLEKKIVKECGTKKKE